jgi:hypothetical protein
MERSLPRSCDERGPPSRRAGTIGIAIALGDPEEARAEADALAAHAPPGSVLLTPPRWRPSATAFPTAWHCGLSRSRPTMAG